MSSKYIHAHHLVSNHYIFNGMEGIFFIFGILHCKDNMLIYNWITAQESKLILLWAPD